MDLSRYNVRDVSEIGHYGTGDVEIRIENVDEVTKGKELIRLSYENNS